jgi:CheY-like chemotaxis protein
MPRILIIDDDPQIRSFLRLSLQGAGHEVRTASNGAAGLHCACAEASEGVDLIFCDLFMPGKNGLETIRELTREAPGIPVIAMSGGGQHGQVDLLRVARGLGAVSVLAKPFLPAAITKAVRDVLAPPPEQHKVQPS